MSCLDWIFRSRYVRFLEGEVARLRAENRGLTNSLLAVAGHTPVEFGEKKATTEVKPRRRLSLWQQQQKTEQDSERRILERDRAQQAGKNPDAA